MKTSRLRQRLIETLTIKGYSKRTIGSYVMAVAQLAKHYKRSPEDISDEEIRAYLYWMRVEKKAAASTINVAVNGLRFFYREIMKRPAERIAESLPRSRRSKRLPTVYSVDEVRLLFEKGFISMKHRTVCMTLYGGGLRISEALHLKPEHIDGQRMLIRVEQGKGRKDRYTLLPKSLLLELRSYWTRYQPKVWLFPSRQRPNEPVGSDTIQRAFKKALKRAALPIKGGPHTLRHSFATHLIEGGTPLHVIKMFLGHKSATTTAVYLHITQNTLDNVKSPLDAMVLGKPLAF